MEETVNNRERPMATCAQEKNRESCPCTYASCPRRGNCCECIRYHMKQRQLPGCAFPSDAERTYDRSFEHFSRLVVEKQI